MHGLLDTENRLVATIVVSEKDETGHGFCSAGALHLYTRLRGAACGLILEAKSI